jgi:pimeloyl-ACP methyl ester carboxylesterase
MLKQKFCLAMTVNLVVSFSLVAQEAHTITPHKYTDSAKMPHYEIPASSRHTVSRYEAAAPDIIYYMSMPKAESYPIAILCGGSSNRNTIGSIIHFHRYLLQEFMDLNVGVVTVEQWGVDGATVQIEEFMHHYTRSQRLQDHIVVIEKLIGNRPLGWNGKLIFLGASEGGPLITALTIRYPDITLATVNWVGAGDWNWREELWVFVQNMRKNAAWWLKLWDLVPQWMPFALNIPKDRLEYDLRMDETVLHPCVDKEFLGMTYLYHADALQWPMVEYEKIKTPYLVVAGAQDSIIDSCDAFVCKAQDAGADITYMRIADMDHYIRNRPDIVVQYHLSKKNLR